MLKYYPATVIDSRKEADDAILLTLAVPAHARDEFRYSQGQHLPVRAQVDGEELRRTYSICASVSDDTLRLGVRVQGAVSGHLAGLQPGDAVEVMPPTGHFQVPLDPAHAKHYAAFVAGSGITPILSIVKTTLETEAVSRFTVFYGNRKRSTTMFIEELYALKNLYADRLSLHFVMSREDDEIRLYNGRIDGARARELHDAFLSETRPDDLFLCGPNPMIDDLTETLLAMDYKNENIHTERFRTEEPDTTDGDRPPAPEAPAGTVVTIVMDGNRQTFEMEDPEQPLLDAALDAGFDLPYSCMGGVCSTCRTRLTKGKVNMEVNQALEDWELEKGFILACQAHPETDEIEIDYDQT